MEGGQMKKQKMTFEDILLDMKGDLTGMIGAVNDKLDAMKTDISDKVIQKISTTLKEKIKESAEEIVNTKLGEMRAEIEVLSLTGLVIR